MNEFSQFASYPSLAGRVTFITGGASGIGAELVRQFARQRSRVAFIDIDDIAAKRLVETAAAEGSPGPYYIPCDVRDIEALQAAIEVAGRELGPVTVLINNAANDERHPFETVSVIDWDDRQNVNLRPHFFANSVGRADDARSWRRICYQSGLDYMARWLRRPSRLFDGQGRGRRPDEGYGPRTRVGPHPR